ncbi:heme peroxidase [Alternaria alternata]|nr:heme peroxidase [Alternaria alternata]
MYIRNVLISGLAAASTVQAYSNYTIREEEWIVAPPAPVQEKRTIGRILGLFGGLFGGNKEPAQECPAIWTQISSTLTQQFLGDGQCTDAARAAIRSSFHDCFNGACDGSLILAQECSNTENRGLERLCGNLANVASQTKVGVADLIQFAAAHAVKTCPGGPTIPVKVGRKDSSEANALGVLPSGFARGGDLVKLFDPSKAGAALDSTVGTWDNKYYSETKRGSAPFTLESDKNIAQNPLTAIPFSTFAASKGMWDSAFVGAMVKMSMLGVEDTNLIDCTSALPGGSKKRDVKSSNLFDRLKW